MLANDMNAFLKWLTALLTAPQKPVARVIVFGATVGALAVMAGMVLGELKQGWYAVIVPYLALGTGAAFATVFDLLVIKTEDVLRCCGVALLAGFFWCPVFDAGKDYFLNQPERAAEQLGAPLGHPKTSIRQINSSIIPPQG